MQKQQWDSIANGETVEVTEDDFENFLDCLPPAFMGRMVELMDGKKIHADYGFVEGTDRITAFWQDRTTGKCFAAGTKLFSRGY